MPDDKKKDEGKEAKPKQPPPEFAAVDHPADPKQTHQAKEWKHNCPFLACRFGPQGKYVFAAAQDFTIQRFPFGEGKAVPLAGHESWVRGLAFNPDGNVLITGGFDQRLIWWEAVAAEPKIIRQIDKAHDGWIRRVNVSPDGKLVATCGNDHRVKLWTIEGEPVRELTGHTAHVYNVVFHPDGKSLASADLKGVVKHWDVDSGNEVRELKADKLHKYDNTFRADIGGARAMAFSPDGKYLACAGITNVSNAFAGIGNPAVALFDWESGNEAQFFKTKKNLRGVCWGLAFHPGGFLIGAMGGNGGYLLFWKGDSADEFHQVKLKSDARDLTLHPDGLHLATCHYDQRVRLFKMAAQPKAEKKPAKKS